VEELQRMVGQLAPVGLRVAGLMTFAPFLGSPAITPRIKVGLAIALTALLYPTLPAQPPVATLSAWTQMALSEVLVGLMMGLTVHFIFEAAQLAGQLAGFQLGFSLANVIDPLSQVDTPVLSIFHQVIALLIFLQLNVHHWVLRGLAKSFEFLPVGSAVATLGATRQLLLAAGGMWLVGVQIAAPVLLATMIVDIFAGFLSKASPHLPALFVALSVKSLVGYVVLAGAIVLWPGLLEKQFASALACGEQLLRLAR
jgi:flagellar biosynthetic protein FliR